MFVSVHFPRAEEPNPSLPGPVQERFYTGRLSAQQKQTAVFPLGRLLLPCPNRQNKLCSERLYNEKQTEGTIEAVHRIVNLIEHLNHQHDARGNDQVSVANSTATIS